MVLTDEKAKQFYDLWIPLLDFVNQKYKLIKELYGMTSPKGLPIQSVALISSKLQENKDIIDEFVLSDFKKMDEEKTEIVNSWKKAIHGKFIVRATLMPFKDVIIHDGIVAPYGVCLGKNMSEQSKQIYLTAKANGNLHYNL